MQALDGSIIQCVYSILDNLIKSNAVKYSFIPPGQSGIRKYDVPLWSVCATRVCPSLPNIYVMVPEHIKPVLVCSVCVCSV